MTPRSPLSEQCLQMRHDPHGCLPIPERGNCALLPSARESPLHGRTDRVRRPLHQGDAAEVAGDADVGDDAGDGAHLVRDAGFVIERTSSRYARGPKPWSWFTEGFAANPVNGETLGDN